MFWGVGRNTVTHVIMQKSLTDKDLLNETKLAYIDVVVLRFIPAHERVVPGHCQPG